jgi:hypothetical protein
MFTRHLSPRFQSVLCLSVAMLATTQFSTPASAAITQEAVNRAHSYLKTREMGVNVLSFVHFGAAYKGHAFVRTLPVNDAAGCQLPDDFALVYRFQWEDDGVTEVAFLCDGQGRVYKTQIMNSNGRLQQPFAMANLAIQVLGNAITDSLRDSLTDKDRAELKRLVESADAQGLLNVYLRLGQPSK